MTLLLLHERAAAVCSWKGEVGHILRSLPFTSRCCEKSINWFLVVEHKGNIVVRIVICMCLAVLASETDGVRGDDITLRFPFFLNFKKYGVVWIFCMVRR